MSLFTLPLRLPYIGASTIEDAAGETVAECPDNAVAAALVILVNFAREASVTDRPALIERARLRAVFESIEETE